MLNYLVRYFRKFFTNFYENFKIYNNLGMRKVLQYIVLHSVGKFYYEFQRNDRIDSITLISII